MRHLNENQNHRAGARLLSLLAVVAVAAGCASSAPNGALMPGGRHVALFTGDRVLGLDRGGNPAWARVPGNNESWGGQKLEGTASPRVGERVVLCTVWGTVEGRLVSDDGDRSIVRFTEDWLVEAQLGAPVRPAGEPAVCLGVLTGISSADPYLGLIQRPPTGPVVARAEVVKPGRPAAVEVAGR